MGRKILSIFLLLILGVTGVYGASVKLSVSPQRGKNIIEAGDLYYLNIVVSDIKETPGRPNVPGSKLVYFDKTSESSNFSSINGVTSQSFTSTYTATLRAEKEGSYTFGPITLGGVRSNTVKINIGKQNSTDRSSAPVSSSGLDNDDDSKPKYIGKGDSNLFLRATVSESTAYEQQALVYTVKLYSTYDAIKFIGATSAPKFDGFVIEESKDVSNSLTLETYQGKTYATAVIARYIIFPQMPGTLKITGNTYTISVDRREYFHDAFWGNMSYSTPLQLNVTPNDLTINVKSLPEPKPSDFSGGVGEFSISSQLKNNEFKTNQAASIVYEIKGTGNIKYIQLPDLSGVYPPEIEVYTPKTTQNVTVGSSNVSGQVVFDYSFMPLEEGEFKIPDIKLVYFNPSLGQYQTSVAKGYTIKVGKGKETENKTARKRFDPSLQKIKQDTLKKEVRPYVSEFVYWLWYIVPVVIFAFCFFYYRRYVSLHSDMISLNSKRANKIAAKRLKKAAAAMRRNDSEAFYDELLTSLWGYLGDKLKMPTSELLRDNVRQVLNDNSIPEPDIDRFIGVIDEAEFAKYSSNGDSVNIRKIYDDAVMTINEMEKAFNKNKS